MGWEKKIKALLVLHLMLLLFTVVSIVRLEPSVATYFSLYEIFGALSAATITVFGLWKMKSLTED